MAIFARPAGIAALFLASAALAQSGQVNRMAECKLTLVEANKARESLKNIGEHDLSNELADEYEIAYDPKNIRPFGMETRSFYYATFVDDKGADQMFQSIVEGKYADVKKALAGSFGECVKEVQKGDLQTCVFPRQAATQVRPMVVLDEGAGTLSILCSYPN